MKVVPRLQNLAAPIDTVAVAFGVDRINGEEFYSYIERLIDRMKIPPSQSRVGLSVKIARNLGLLSFFPIEIDIYDQFAPITIDGTNVYVVEDTLFDTTASYADDAFIGYPLVIGGIWFEIISNTSNSITVSSPTLETHVNTVASATYTVKAARLPVIEITRSRILLYEYFVNNNINNIDLEVALDHDIPLTDVVTKINTSSVFKATLLPTARYDLSEVVSRSILPQNSYRTVQRYGNGSKHLDLGVNNIVRGAISSVPEDFLIREVQSISQMTQVGDYYIDYAGGELYTFTAMPSNVGVKAIYSIFPYRPICSLVFTDDLRDSEYQRLVFQQIPNDIYENSLDKYINASPQDRFFEDYGLVRKRNNVFWGK